MTEYKKKKQLIEDNEDMYFSDYDKTLSYDALSRVADAKRDYITAAKNNDKEGMTKANDVANAVRAKYGSFTGGEDGSLFLVKPHELYRFAKLAQQQGLLETE